MTYNFDLASSINISIDTVNDMIKAIVEEQTGRKVESIKFNSHTEHFEFGRIPLMKEVIDSATVTFGKDASDN